MTRCVCTIASINYTAQVLTLGASLRLHEPDAAFHFLVVDKVPTGYAESLPPWINICAVEDLGIEDFWKKALMYDALELNTNVKPRWLLRLLDRFDEVVYLDPDICVYGPLEPVWTALQTGAIILTPHILSPTPDDHATPSDAGFLAVGVFNLGFIAVRRCQATARLLGWWDGKCMTEGWNAPHTGVFVDQKWTNLLPCFSDQCTILRHPGCNVAYWNLHERQIASGPGKSVSVRFEGAAFPLVFFHFSGYRPELPGMLSKYEDRFATPPPSVAPLAASYAASLLGHGYTTWSAHSYAYSAIPDGTRISTAGRRAAASQVTTEEELRSPGFGRWLRAAGLGTQGRDAARSAARDAETNVLKKRILWLMCRMLTRAVGHARYQALLDYLPKLAAPAEQRNIFPWKR